MLHYYHFSLSILYKIAGTFCIKIMVYKMYYIGDTERVFGDTERVFGDKGSLFFCEGNIRTVGLAFAFGFFAIRRGLVFNLCANLFGSERKLFLGKGKFLTLGRDLALRFGEGNLLFGEGNLRFSGSNLLFSGGEGDLGFGDLLFVILILK